jgi:O-antigen/teichoic acid export membrane protein
VKLRQAASLSAVQTATTMVCAFASVKITSHYLGPAGIGTLGQLLQFIVLTFGLVSSGINNGLVRRMPEVEHDAAARASLLATALKIKLLLGMAIGAAIIASSSWLAGQLLHDPTLRLLFIVFGLAYPVGLAGLFVFGAANAHKDLRTSTLYSIWSSVVGLLIFVALCPWLGTYGALIGTAAAPLAVAGAAVVLARLRPWWLGGWRRVAIQPAQARALLAMMPAAAVCTVGAPLVQLLLRDQLADRAGLDAVGFVQTLTRLTELYLSVVSTLFLVYYLRRFSEIQRAEELRDEVFRALKLIVPAVSVIAVLMFLSRDLIIQILLTPAFSPMRDLFAWQMAGSVLQVVALMFFYLMTAKLHPAIAVPYQIGVHASWWALGHWLIDRNGVMGAPQAYAAATLVQAVVGAIGFWWVYRRLKAQ